ncbi:MAG: MauE/DoxX family redox-associated membrane protein [bacterium]
MAIELGAAVSRVAVGVMLIVAGLAKAANREHFSEVLRRFPIARLVLRSQASSRVFASTLSVVEMVSGLLFALGLGLLPIGVLILVLLSAFSLGLTTALMKGEDVACGCFGDTSGKQVRWLAVARNMALILLTLGALRFPHYSLDSTLSGTMPVGAYAAFILLSAQTTMLLGLALAFFRLRGAQGYVRHVPPVLEGALNEVWIGMREVRRHWGGKG